MNTAQKLRCTPALVEMLRTRNGCLVRLTIGNRQFAVVNGTVELAKQVTVQWLLASPAKPDAVQYKNVLALRSYDWMDNRKELAASISLRRRGGQHPEHVAHCIHPDFQIKFPHPRRKTITSSPVGIIQSQSGSSPRPRNLVIRIGHAYFTKLENPRHQRAQPFLFHPGAQRLPFTLVHHALPCGLPSPLFRETSCPSL